jgi:protein-tyrosine phosphatase
MPGFSSLLESENVAADWSKIAPKIVPRDFPLDLPPRKVGTKPEGARQGTVGGIPRGMPDGIKEIFWIAQPDGVSSSSLSSGSLSASTGSANTGSASARAPRLAIVLRPRGGQLLRSELIKFKEAGIRILVSLMEANEAVSFGLAEEPQIAEELGLMFMPFPMRDHSIPRDAVSFRGFVQDLAERLKAGRAVGIHCQGSIGRATVTAACTLIHLGWKPSVALAAIQEARGCQVPDMQEQEDWILGYKA